MLDCWTRGSFRRPFRAAIWVVHLSYTLLLAVLLSVQNVDKARNLLSHVLSGIGLPLSEKFYAEDCRLYTPGEAEGSFHIIMDKMDIFVPAHLFGWMIKALIIRDYWLLMILSVGFELLEYTLEPQLPNFGECWWDHWILDALLCNGLGMWFGMRLVEYLKLRKYRWSRLWRTGPAQMWSSFSCFFCTCFLVFLILLTELNIFYMKTIFWIPPHHWIITARHVLLGLTGVCAVQELYECLSAIRSSLKHSFGYFVCLVLSSSLCELLLVVKFGGYLLAIPLHPYAYLGWTVGILLLLMWTVWKFIISSNQ